MPASVQGPDVGLLARREAEEGEQVPDFNLNSIFSGNGVRDPGNASKSLSSQFLGGLENIGLNFTAGLATVGLGAIAKKGGLNPNIASPANVAYNAAILTAKPGTVSGLAASLGPNSSLIVIGGLLFVGVLVVALVSRRKGS